IEEPFALSNVGAEHRRRDAGATVAKIRWQLRWRRWRTALCQCVHTRCDQDQEKNDLGSHKGPPELTLAMRDATGPARIRPLALCRTASGHGIIRVCEVQYRW